MVAGRRRPPEIMGQPAGTDSITDSITDMTSNSLLMSQQVILPGRARTPRLSPSSVNPVPRCLQGNLNSPDGLVGLQRRFVMFGGGISKQQLAWLSDQLAAAEAARQLVLVCSHLPIAPDTCPPACLIWNYDEVLAVMRRHVGVVVGSLAGHSHQNGYALDDWGLHHAVLPGVVETEPERRCHGVIQLHERGMELVGVDTVMSMRMPSR